MVGQFIDQIADRLAGVVNLPVLVGIHARAAGEANILLAFGRLQHGLRQRPAGTEEIDLENQKVVDGFHIQHIIERRIGGDAAIPIMLAVDDN